jgi:hypothetical protein
MRHRAGALPAGAAISVAMTDASRYGTKATGGAQRNRHGMRDIVVRRDAGEKAATGLQPARRDR